jgi:hypothetical protein
MILYTEYSIIYSSYRTSPDYRDEDLYITRYTNYCWVLIIFLLLISRQRQSDNVAHILEQLANVEETKEVELVATSYLSNRIIGTTSIQVTDDVIESPVMLHKQLTEAKTNITSGIESLLQDRIPNEAQSHSTKYDIEASTNNLPVEKIPLRNDCDIAAHDSIDKLTVRPMAMM